MKFYDINKHFSRLTKTNELLGHSLKGMMPDYTTAFGGAIKMNELLGDSLKGMMPDYATAFGGAIKMNELLGDSLKGMMPDYATAFGSATKANELLGHSLKGMMPDYATAFGGAIKMNELLGHSLKGIVPDYTGLFSGIDVLSGALKHFNLEDTFLSKECLDAYCEENDISDNGDKSEIQAFAEDLSTGKSINGRTLSDAQKYFFATFIYPLILMIIPLIFQSLTAMPTVINTTTYTYSENYYKTEVNNYYTVEQGFDGYILNSNNLKFVCKSQIIVRKCADNSSPVVSKLLMGKVVMVIGKHKKWVEISWKDEAGNYFSGWVQNWKLSEFK